MIEKGYSNKRFFIDFGDSAKRFHTLFNDVKSAMVCCVFTSFLREDTLFRQKKNQLEDFVRLRTKSCFALNFFINFSHSAKLYIYFTLIYLNFSYLYVVPP